MMLIGITMGLSFSTSTTTLFYLRQSRNNAAANLVPLGSTTSTSTSTADDKVVRISSQGKLTVNVALPLSVEPTTGQFALPTSIRRVWIDVGTHARAGNTRPFLDDQPTNGDLFIIGFEPMRYQWGEISTINYEAPNKGWGYGHDRMVVLPAAASSTEGWKTFHRNAENMCSSLNQLGDTQPCGKVVEEYPIAAVRLQSILERIPPSIVVEFIKIDAQGHDLEVVKGMDKDVMNSRVKHVVLEVQNMQQYQQGSTYDDVVEYLQHQCGWKLVSNTRNGIDQERNLAFDNPALVTSTLESQTFWRRHKI